MIRRSLVPLVLCAALLPAVPGSAVVDATAVTDEPTPVTVGDDFFDPQAVTVDPGTTVRWTQEGYNPHSVTADDGSFDSHPGCGTGGPCMQQDDTFEHTFAEAGSFNYYCRIHGAAGGVGMSGVVDVVEPEDPTSIPSEVNSLDAVNDPDADDQVLVSGAARFGGQQPVLVSEDAGGDAPGMTNVGDTTTPDAAGVDLLGAWLSTPDPSNPELLVQWQVSDLPATGGIPEGTRYSLPFTVGGTTYQVHASFSSVASPEGIDDPQGAAERVGGSFELRSDCTEDFNGTGVPRCSRIAWLDGDFDEDEGVVSARVPLGTVAPDLAPGVLLQRNDTGIAELDAVIAGYQVAGMVPSDELNDEASFGPPDEPDYAFPVAQKEVTLGVAPVGTDPLGVDYTTPAALADDDTFSGTLSTAGFSPGTFDVYAKACFGGNCGARSLGGMTLVGDGEVATLKLDADPDQSFAFWRGGLVGSGALHSQATAVGGVLQNVADCDNTPCFRYSLKVASAGAERLRIAIDTPARADNFRTEVTTPDGDTLVEQNANNFNREFWIDDPEVGDYEILVRPYSAGNTTFGMRAKLEAEIPTPQVEPDGSILPDLRPSAPYDLWFAAPVNPAAGFAPDDANPPLDVGGVHPVSCAWDETRDDFVTRCLRFSFGLVNAGQGNFDIRWIADDDGPVENFQCVQQEDGAPEARHSGYSQLHETHAHWHFLDLITAELLHVDDPETGALQRRGDGRKLGYFPADQGLAHWFTFDAGRRASSSTFGNCLPGNTNRLGMAPGWGDVYRYQRPGNFVAFDGNPDGLYVVRLTINQHGIPDGEEPGPQGGLTHQVVSAGFRYAPGDTSVADVPTQMILEGDSLEHTNFDGEPHNLSALEDGPDGRPWFRSPLISAGETAAVPVEHLRPGDYSYTCDLHPSMRGTLRVLESATASGPAPSDAQILESDYDNNIAYAYVRVTGNEVEVLEQGRGRSPWDPDKEVLRPRYIGGVPW